MNISLTPELEARVKAKVESGLYNNASEVIREALRFMELNEKLIDQMKLIHMKREIQLGIDQLERGEGIVVDSKEELDALFQDIMSD